MLLAASLVALAVVLLFVAIAAKWGSHWLQAYMSGADVSMKSLIVMTFLKIDHRSIVTPKIMGRQAGLRIDREGGMSTDRLQAHYLAGGDVMNVVRAIIVAQRAGIDLDFDRAAAIDLAGRNPLHAVQTSVSPKVIHCPKQDGDGRKSLSAIARNGVELLVSARVTVRTNLDQLIGGATEETIIARVGQGIVTAIGSADSHMDVLEKPHQISSVAMEHGLDANTAFEIVSIDIADISVGENIGARLQKDQADADTRIARARAEIRRADAVAEEQKMKAKVTKCRADLLLAEAAVPAALADAFRKGNLGLRKPTSPSNLRRKGTGGETAATDRGMSPRPPRDDKGASSNPLPGTRESPE
jgi:uncharacterized protein YqfA (UPF0365 family)